jgi:hypothetical protein
MTIRELLELLERRLLTEGADPENMIGPRFIIEAQAASGGVRIEMWDAADRRVPIATSLLAADQLAVARKDLWNRLEPK